jgi:aminomethyltransferase
VHGHDNVRKTELFDLHVKAGGKMVPFAGFWMPVQFESIAKEHERVRTKVGLFDVSHMGEVVFRGERALSVVQRITTNNVGTVMPGKAVYTPVCLPTGGIVDDMIFYKVSDTEWFVCVNASNKDKDYQWFLRQADGECEVLDLSDSYSQIAVQGPNAPELLSRVFGDSALSMKPFTFAKKDFKGTEVILATTGYTGEKGGEIYVPNAAAVALWLELTQEGESLGVGPIGLGARDSLRLEMNYCLYGNDIDDTTTPMEAGLSWTVKFDKGDFTGRDILVRQRDEGCSRQLVTFVVEGKGIARHGYPVLVDDRQVGHVTSGTLSPTLGIAVGMAYIDRPFDAPGTKILIDIKGMKKVEARVVQPPLLKR